MNHFSLGNENQFIPLAGSEESTRLAPDVLAAIPDAILILDAAKQRALCVNFAFVTLTERDIQTLHGEEFHPLEIVHSDDHHRFHQLGDPGDPECAKGRDLRLCTGSGSVVPVEAFATFVSDGTNPGYWIYFFRAVESRIALEKALEEQIAIEKKRTVEAVKSSLRIYQLTEKVRAAPKLSTLLLDVRNEEELFRRAGDFLVSQGLNYVEAAIFLLEGQNLKLRYSSSNRSRMSYDVKKGNRYARYLLEGEQPQDYDNVQLVALRTNEKPIGVLEVVFDPRERALFMENQLIVEWNNDILETIAEILALFLENIRLYQKLRDQTMLDPLTSVYNRHFLLTHLESEIQKSKKLGRHVSLVFTDVDGFKRVNDENGHHNGDMIIQEIAFLLKSALRDSDVICRYGGDEFVILLTDTDVLTAEKRADELRAEIENHCFRIADRDTGDAKELRLTISAGVTSTEYGRNAHGLLQAADLALYGAKREGKNCVYLVEDLERESTEETLVLPSAAREKSAVDESVEDRAVEG